jgi:phage terminase large subunit
MGELELQIPKKLLPLVKSEHRYKVLHGGRGGGKSWTISDLMVIKAYQSKKFIPCLRQYQVSIRDSVHKLLSNSIEKFNLTSFFNIQENKIVGLNGSEFIFKGLARNINNIKSLEGADIIWITEAVDVTHEGWKKLIPTIRKPGSEIWIDFNPDEEEDSTYQRFVINPPENSIVIKINYDENPFLTQELLDEMEYDKKYNPDEYPNIWLGECKRMSESRIMRHKWEIKEFETPEEAIFYYGSDWGNTGTNDPDCIVRCFIQDECLYIDYEAYSHVQEIEDYEEFYSSMEGLKEKRDQWKVVCDNTMEKFRKYLVNKGFWLENAQKGPGSIEAGIKFIRSFKRIYIHPRCKHAIFEFKNYRYKTDPKTNEILNIIIDKHNHIIDSLRYALERVGNFSYGRITKTTGW